jgi:hypothetical protein
MRQRSRPSKAPAETVVEDIRRRTRKQHSAENAYHSYDALTRIARDSGPWQLVYCWTHARRRL